MRSGGMAAERRDGARNFLARLIVATGVLAWAVLGATLVQAAPVSGRTEHVSVEIVTDRAADHGGTIWVAITQRIIPGWHTYWLNPGDSGLPTTIAWTLPPGVEAGDILWPTPERFLIGPLVNYGYGGAVTLLAPLRIGADLAPGAAKAGAEIAWLVCAEVCIPESLKFDLDLSAIVGDPGVFAAARARLPQSPPEAVEASATPQAMTLSLDMDPSWTRNPAEIYFFPASPDLLDAGAVQKVSIDGRRLTLSAARKGAEMPVQGVLRLGSVGLAVPEVDATPLAATPAGVAPAPQGDGAEDIGLAEAAVFAFLGGLILNLMPCVLPVLSMKALALAGAGGSARALRRDGLFYLAGVVASFGAIAGALLALKSGGEAIGWGFQLQSPGVVLALALLMAAIGFNLFGLFEVPLSLAGIGDGLTRERGGRGAFFTGVLAVLVASPCTAPFMGAALGFALTQGAAPSLAVFLALGVGFAAPFTALAFSPALVRLIPRPGPWMLRFKEFLAFPMFATAIWLVWVLSQQTGPTGVALALSAGLGFAFLVWVTPLAPGLVRPVLVLGGLAALVWLGARLEPMPTRVGASGPWAPWSQAAVETARAAHRPVLVDFTAAWCVTCLVNERVALGTEGVTRRLEAERVVTLKGDWTSRDPAITAELARHGRAGVPLYLLYPPGSAEPRVLPQILTPDIILSALDALPRAEASR